MSSTFRLPRYLVRSGIGHGGVSLSMKCNGQVGGVRKEAGRHAGGCKSRTEVTGGRAGNWPSQVEVRNLHYTAFECYIFVFNSNQFNCSIQQLKEQGGVQPQVANNGREGRIGWTGKRFS